MGAVLGVVAFAFIAMAGERDWLDTIRMFWLAAALFGAGIGGVLAPISAWSLMRHVPLWRAIVETSVGTTLGVIAGYFCAYFSRWGMLWPIALGVLGFLLAAIRLRITARRSGATAARTA